MTSSIALIEPRPGAPWPARVHRTAAAPVTANGIPSAIAKERGDRHAVTRCRSSTSEPSAQDTTTAPTAGPNRATSPNSERDRQQAGHRPARAEGDDEERRDRDVRAIALRIGPADRRSGGGHAATSFWSIRRRKTVSRSSVSSALAMRVRPALTANSVISRWTDADAPAVRHDVVGGLVAVARHDGHRATPGISRMPTSVAAFAPPRTTRSVLAVNDPSRTCVGAALTRRPWSRIATWSLTRWTSSRMWVE